MPTYQLIASTTVVTPAYSVTMSSIPSTYTDLLIVASMRSDYSGSSEGQFLINSITSGTYSGKLLTGNGSSVNSYSSSSAGAATWGLVINGSASTSNTFSNVQIYMPNYSSTTSAKSFSIEGVTENNGTSALTWLVASGNTTTAAINSITFQAWQSFINFVAGTTFYIYGISNA
jgi:hypothetical protein